MNTQAQTALRQELHAFIDSIPEKRLTALRPLLADLAEGCWEPVIEPASPEELAMIEKGMKEYEKNPESFITLSEYKKSRGIKNI